MSLDVIPSDHAIPYPPQTNAINPTMYHILVGNTDTVRATATSLSITTTVKKLHSPIKPTSDCCACCLEGSYNTKIPMISMIKQASSAKRMRFRPFAVDPAEECVCLNVSNN